MDILNELGKIESAEQARKVFKNAWIRSSYSVSPASPIRKY